MAYEQKNMTGSIFKNSKKTTGKHPDRRGDCTIDGQQYWVSGWIKQDRNGDQFLSLAFQKKEAAQDTKPVAGSPRKSAKDDLDDFIPFAPETRA